ncbi:MAG: TonB-dependent receptor [Chitinophagaceae bacterium]|nr:TonB-dependent receptor [Chitinophagaceae bacterium]
MKRIAFIGLFMCSRVFAQVSEPVKDSFYTLQPLEVRAITVSYKTPVTNNNISKQDITLRNLGQDLPFMLNQLPSVVVNSDAGNGFGYTGLRIRGTDATRINITMNGIPYNDAESQGTFFVDLPDIASSTSGIQVQRGVGTSTNGSGAFGANINISTSENNTDAYAELNNSFGSFGSRKHTFKTGTGLIKDHFSADIRLSQMSSDGYIDRASSSLHSWFATTAYRTKKSTLRLNILSGKEKTYQAWYGITEEDLKAGNRRINYAGTEKPGDPYDNETDNYKQDHYQFFWNYRPGNAWNINTALFWTRGKGYYEQYKAEEDYAKYNINRPGSSDFIRRLWLDNDYYGSTFSVQRQGNNARFTAGGLVARYKGRHFGEITWASNGMPDPIHRWYDLDANKTDISFYIKEEKTFRQWFNLFADIQFRPVKYQINGFRDNPALEVKNNWNFINPKAGISYIRNNWKTYVSFAVANKEPNRDDFEAGKNQQPKPERLFDTELGIEKNGKKYSWSAVFYNMRYKDQLVLNGQINDVGAYTRINIPNSQRTGVELSGQWKPVSEFRINATLALSKNKVKNFTEYIDDYDNGGQKLNQYKSTDIAYSPSVVASAEATWVPVKNFSIAFPAKYVSKQHLDNTGNEARVLSAFYVQDCRLNYSFKTAKAGEWKLIVAVNNLFGRKYEPNGYTYNYIYGGELVVNNYYFPMAGTNWMAGVNIKL